MRKEVVWAILAGIIFGLVIAFGVWRINLNFKSVSQIKSVPTPAPQPVDTSQFKITLDKPQNDDVVTESSVMISGITSPSSWVVLSAEDEDYVVEVDPSGVFEREIDLVAGVNQITLTALDATGGQSKENLLVVHSSAFEKREGVLEASESGSSIRDKVAAKVEELMYRPKAYLGVVTDIAESTIQVRSKSGEIKQISTNTESVVVTKDSGIKVTTVKFDDIAIGDFVVAMGYINGNSVLTAQRILITPQIEESVIDVLYGKAIDLLSSPKPTAKVSIFTFEEGKATKVKLTNIEDEQNVIFIKDRTIFTLPLE